MEIGCDKVIDMLSGPAGAIGGGAGGVGGDGNAYGGGSEPASISIIDGDGLGNPVGVDGDIVDMC